MMQNRKLSNLAHGVVRGTVNGEPLRARVQIESFGRSGLQFGRVHFDQKPDSFAAIAGSGSSWLSWCNNREAEQIDGTTNLMTLSDGNYTVERQNQYEDGSRLDMFFKVWRRSDGEIQMEAEWSGTYGLPVDVSLETPIFEDLDPDGPGVFRGIYPNHLVTTSGERLSMITPSVYRFDPIPGRPETLPFKQRRLTTISYQWYDDGKELRMVSHSLLVPATLVPDRAPLYLAATEPSREPAGFSLI